MTIKDRACFQHVTWTPTRSDLNTFALTMLVGFAIIGGIVAWRNDGIGAPAIRLWEIGAALAMGGVIPVVGRYVYVAVYVVTGIIGYAISRVILTLMFYAIVTPLGVILRLTGKDLLRLRRHAGDSYWIAHVSNRDRKRYYRQF